MCHVHNKEITDKLKCKMNVSKSKRLITYSGNKIVVIGETDLNCEWNNKVSITYFKIINQEVEPILGKASCEKEGFIERIKSIREEDAIYPGLGCKKNHEHNINFVKNPQFDVKPPRKTQYEISDAVKQELEIMKELTQKGVEGNLLKSIIIKVLSEDRDSLFWRNTIKDITTKVQECSSCEQRRRT